jgi:hypothetical protein
MERTKASGSSTRTPSTLKAWWHLWWNSDRGDRLDCAREPTDRSQQAGAGTAWIESGQTTTAHDPTEGMVQ